MKTNRRRFVQTNLLGGLAAALPLTARGADGPRPKSKAPNPRYAKLDEILRQPVLKRKLFPSPVIIEQGKFMKRTSRPEPKSEVRR